MGKIKRAMSQVLWSYILRTLSLTWDSERLHRRRDTPGIHPEEEERTFLAEGLAQQRMRSVKQDQQAM